MLFQNCSEYLVSRNTLPFVLKYFRFTYHIYRRGFLPAFIGALVCPLCFDGCWFQKHSGNLSSASELLFNPTRSYTEDLVSLKKDLEELVYLKDLEEQMLLAIGVAESAHLLSLQIDDLLGV